MTESDTHGEEVERTAEEIIQHSLRQARRNEAKAQETLEPEQAAFFKGIAAAHRGVVEDATTVEYWEELSERRRTCPSCDGGGCDRCDGFGYVRVEASADV